MTENENWRGSLGAWIESVAVQKFVIVLILVNAAILGIETSRSAMTEYGTALIMLDHIILGVFVIEIFIKLLAFDWRFFKNPWNVFDFMVVGIALVPASGPLAILRALRVLRVLRLVSMMPRLRFVVEALLHALPGIGSIAMLMLVMYYVFSVMATGLFGDRFPEWFGTIGESMYTLFQIMTLESWSMGIVRPVMETYPYAWLFFVPFILIATFTILNLFIAIIVDTMQTLHDQTDKNEKVSPEFDETSHSSAITLEIRELRNEVQALKTLLQSQANNVQA